MYQSSGNGHAHTEHSHDVDDLSYISVQLYSYIGSNILSPFIVQRNGYADVCTFAHLKPERVLYHIGNDIEDVTEIASKENTIRRKRLLTMKSNGEASKNYWILKEEWSNIEKRIRNF